jgi:predicted ABC-type ATPase
MDLVAGPQGSGKSTFFPVAQRGHDAFNVDDRRRELNSGSARRIPPEVRRRAIKEYGEFIEGHIRRRRSFAIEVTLGKEIAFEQAERARQAGFRVHLTYVAAEIDDCIGRVANRVEAGGHGVSASVLRETYAASMRNLSKAVRDFDVVQVYDNSREAQLEDAPEDIPPQLVLEAQRGTVTYAHPRPPLWLRAALRGTTHELG